MAEINWGLAQTDPVAAQAQAYSYADKVRQNAAGYQAGAQYAKGDLTGAAQTQAQAGDIPQAQATQQYSQQTAAKGQAYIAQALPVFQKIAEVHANDPDKGAAALSAAFDHIAPEAQAVTGATPQALAAFKNALVSDPTGTISRLQAQVPTEFKSVGDDLITFKNGQPLNRYTGTKTATAGPGQTVIQYGGSQQPMGQSSPQAATDAPAGPPSVAAPAAAAPATQSASLIPAVDTGAMHAVESRGNPNAVSPVGAMGVSQVMPATAADPGFGVAPAKDNSPAELQRVGDQTLAAYTAHYGNPVLGHIAYNMGPGATDKWLAAGGDFANLPAQTQTYLGRIAVAQAVPQRGSGQQPGPQAQPQQPGPQGANGARVLYQGAPPFRAPTPDELKQYPGATQINSATGEVKYPPASQVAANMTADQLQPFVDNLKAGGALPQSLARNPAAYAKVLQLAGAQGVSMQDVLANQGNRKATQQTFQQVSNRYAMVQTQEQAFNNSLALAQQKIQALGNNGGGKFALAFKNYLQTGIAGDPATGAAINAVDTAMNEYAKIIEGSTGQGGSSVAARQDANQMLSAADNLPSFLEKVGVLKADAGYKIGALRDQYNTLSGALHSIGEGAPAQSDAGNIPTINTPAEALKLAPGTKFRTPDGRVKIR